MAYFTSRPESVFGFPYCLYKILINNIRSPVYNKLGKGSKFSRKEPEIQVRVNDMIQINKKDLLILEPV